MRVRTERAEIAGEVVIVLKRRQIALRLLLRLAARLRLGACGLSWAMVALPPWKLPTTWSQARSASVAIASVCWQFTKYSVVASNSITIVLW
jgi:hypothetical protein